MTTAEACPNSGVCPVPWVPVESVADIGPSGGETRELVLPTTLQLLGKYGVIDTLP